MTLNNASMKRNPLTMALWAAILAEHMERQRVYEVGLANPASSNTPPTP